MNQSFDDSLSNDRVVNQSFNDSIGNCSDTPTVENVFVVKPEYFLHDRLIFKTAKDLTDFLNYSKFRVDVETKENNYDLDT